MVKKTLTFEFLVFKTKLQKIMYILFITYWLQDLYPPAASHLLQITWQWIVVVFLVQRLLGDCLLTDCLLIGTGWQLIIDWSWSNHQVNIINIWQIFGDEPNNADQLVTSQPPVFQLITNPHQNKTFWCRGSPYCQSKSKRKYKYLKKIVSEYLLQL